MAKLAAASSLVATSVALASIISCLRIDPADARPPGKIVSPAGDFYKSFMDLHCGGIFDHSLFAVVDGICNDCRDTYRNATMGILCRQDCFTSDSFPKCVVALKRENEIKQIEAVIEHLHGVKFSQDGNKQPQ